MPYVHTTVRISHLKDYEKKPSLTSSSIVLKILVLFCTKLMLGFT